MHHESHREPLHQRGPFWTPIKLVELRSEVAALRNSVDALAQGLHLMVETQETHTDLLQRILAAATEPSPSDSPLHDLLARLIAGIDGQTEATPSRRNASCPSRQ